MKKIALFIPLFTLAACGQEPAPEPAPTQAVAPEPVVTMPAPDQQTFRTAFAAACKGAEPVNQAVCKRAGMGSENVVCEYGLGDDEYLRHKATLSPKEDKSGWTLSDPATVCAEHGAEAVSPTETEATESQ